MIRHKILGALNKKMPKEEIVAVEEKSPVEKKLFVHIPKTAGTSFRHALDEVASVCRDYGKNSKETSELIMSSLYKEIEDPFVSYQRFMQSDYEWLCGHIAVAKYVNWISVRNIVVFMRDPIEQMVSHYNHFVSYSNYQGDFASFYQKPNLQNIQSKYMQAIPIELIGVVGITEKYNESLALLGKHFDTVYNEKKSNINTSKTHDKQGLPAADASYLDKSLEIDIQLYEKANQLFLERLRVERLGGEWCHVHAQLNANLVLNGCAFYSNSDESVVLSVLKNGTLLRELKAEGFYGAHPRVNFPRNRFIGFRLPLSKLIEPDDELKLVVKDTGQIISIYRSL